MSNTKNILTPTFRASFAFIDKPQPPMNGQGDAKYKVTMLFDKESADLSELSAAAKQAIADKWGDNPPKNLKNPFRDGAEKEHLDGYSADVIFVTASSGRPPGVVGPDAKRINGAEIYSGCYARARVNAFAYDTAGNRGVAFGLQHIQKVADGEAFGAGAGNPEDAFEAVNKAASKSASASLTDDLLG